MYTQIKVEYKDGQKRRFTTEPMRAMIARSLMFSVFYQDPEIASVRFYDDNKGKPLKMFR